MKKLFLLLSAVGVMMTACGPVDDGTEDGNGNQTEQPGGNDTGNEDAIPTDKIVIKPAAMEVANEACDYIVAIYSPCSWRATTENEWITIETKLGIEGKRELIFSVADCYETEPREGKIIVSNNDEGLSAELTITQKAYVLSEERVIYYTSSDEAVVLPYNTSAFGANIVSNTYENGQGIIIFDATVTSIGEDAFYNCSSLTSVTIGNSVTSIGEGAFSKCTLLTSITIPESVTSIGKLAFYDCTSLTSVTIGNSVTEIGNYAFNECTSLANVYISDLSAWCKISFGDSSASPLYYAKKLYLNESEVTELTIPSDITEIKNYAFYNCSSLTSVTIPDSVTSIGWYAFYNCSSLTSITIPDSVTSIGSYAFYDCTSLTSVTIGNSVTSIGGYAFYYCTSLTSITIPDSVTSIGQYAFYNCSSLTSVTIGNSVTSIGGYAFYYCTNLQEVYCKPTTPPSMGNNLAFACQSGGQYYYIGCTIYVPTASVKAYKAATNWSDYAKYIVGYDF